MKKANSKLTILILAGITLSVAFVSLTGLKDQVMTLIFPSVLVGLSNNERQAEELPVLKVNPKLQQAAQLKALDMAKKGYFSHMTPEGYAPWYWLDQVGYDYLSAGENLAVNFDHSAEVNQAWMNSIKHRENILSKKYTEIGIATAKGKYQGQDSIFVVQFFGKPATPSS